MRYLLCLLAISLVLSGCASKSEREAKPAIKDTAKCVSLGFSLGTEAFGNCRLQLMSIRALELSGSSNGNSPMDNFKAASSPFGGVYSK